MMTLCSDRDSKGSWGYKARLEIRAFILSCSLFCSLSEDTINHSKLIDKVAVVELKLVDIVAVHLFKRAVGSKSKEGSRKSEGLIFLEPTYSTAFSLFAYVWRLIADRVRLWNSGPAHLDEVESVTGLLVFEVLFEPVKVSDSLVVPALRRMVLIL